LVLSHRYAEAEIVFSDGFRYCEDRDLNSWIYYMQSERIKLLLNTGQVEEAESSAIALAYENHPPMVRIAALVVLARIRTRTGNFDEARKLIAEARSLASLTGEAQRIVPVIVAQLELSWIAGDDIPTKEISHAEDNLFTERKHSYHYRMLTQWMQGSEDTPYEKAIESYDLRTLSLLGATATIEKVKSLMKEKGIAIPRGLRDSTKSNPFQLTNRQIDVLNLLSEGLQNTEIADRLFISAKTVDHHISAILSKLDVNSRSRAVSKARETGLLK
jgi:ATP/maltotriose-dependent transcriptional regulator MalT